MDRKNKRHCAGKQTNISDRKKRRVGPENRFVAEKVTVNTLNAIISKPCFLTWLTA